MLCKIEFEAFGGSCEKSPSKYMKKNFFPTFKFVIISFFFVIENPTHWSLETAVCPIFENLVSDIFTVCSLT